MRTLAAVLIFLLTLAPFAISIYGAVLCFQASVVLGFIALVVEPAPLIFGIAGLLGHDLAEPLARSLGL
jgi:hypothetical protein